MVSKRVVHGELLGSSLMNLLILAMLDLSTYSRGKMLSKQAAAHALSGSLSAALTALAGLGLLTGKALMEYAIFNVSPAIILVAIAYALGVPLVYLDQRIAARGNGEHPPQEMPVPGGITLGKGIFGFAICAAVILVAGPFLAHAADTIAIRSGLGKTFVGTTLVAFSTSLPELVSSISALRLGALDLAIGNVFGSNAFNMVLLLPLDLLYAEPLLASISEQHAVTCMATIMATLVAIMGQLYRSESRTRLIEPDAALVIVIVMGTLALIYFTPK